MQETYDVAMTNFLAGGGDGYALLKGNIIEHQLTGDYNSVLLLKTKLTDTALCRCPRR